MVGKLKRIQTALYTVQRQAHDSIQYFAIDTESVGTKPDTGLQQISSIARVSVVNKNLELVFDEHINPDRRVIDY